MQPLEKTLRNKLERTVKKARDVAELASKSALNQLGIGEATPFPQLSEDDRILRRKLRAHGRQLGDLRNPKTETQEIDRLVEEVAYEHWHRMLFARFLAENSLLMYPDPIDPVAVTLEECEDLALDEGAKDGWELASRYAARMLPQIFRPDSPVFLIELSPEHQQNLERLVADLPREVFFASDSLGWVYQFWQAKKKDEINASEVKIGARELPVVTQLFTEPYMVAFLLDNSLGAWWAARRLTHSDLANAAGEEELRQMASLPGVSLDYLRFIRTEGGVWTPAAGTFDAWPEHLSELTTLDPCCGSGHFLVAALLMLVPMRMELEGLSSKEAVDAVLQDNLHGLEIDQRCVELAAFALALAAWRYPDAGGYRPLPEMALACSGLSISAKKEDWLALARGDANLESALEELYEQFKDAPLLGSLIDPKAGLSRGNLLGLGWDDLAPLLTKALRRELDDELKEMGVVAQGIARAAPMLAGRYHWVVTNVPYLARGKQCESLRDYCENQYDDAKNNLATAFLDRCLELCHYGSTTNVVLPHEWLFLTSYRRFREKLLKNDSLALIARLGPGAFEMISGEVVNVMLLTLDRGNKKSSVISFQLEEKNSMNPRNYQLISGIDVSANRTNSEKAALLMNAEVKQVEQEMQLENPDAIISLESLQEHNLSKNILNSYHGLTTGDRNYSAPLPSYLNQA